MYININLFDLFLDCNNQCFFEEHEFYRSKNFAKGYDLIDHAYDILSEDEFCRADTISNLRKAINYRISDLFENLGIDFLNLKAGKDKKIEKLEELNIAKPLLVHKLLKIRNNIEYCGADPPDKDECKELIDFVWYFYKSTDKFCTVKPNSLLMENDTEKYELNIEFDFDFHKVLKIRGVLPASLLGNEKKIEAAVYIEDENFDATKNYFSAEIAVKDIPYYLDILYVALLEW